MLDFLGEIFPWPAPEAPARVAAAWRALEERRRAAAYLRTAAMLA